MIKLILAGQVRTIIAGLGGYLVASGVLKVDEANSFVDALVSITPILVSMAWSAYEKISTAKKLKGD